MFRSADTYGFNWLPREQESVEGCPGFCGGISFWRQEAHLFRDALIALPVRSLLGKLLFFYLFTHYISCLFYFLCFVFSISYLIPTILSVSFWFYAAVSDKLVSQLRCFEIYARVRLILQLSASYTRYLKQFFYNMV